MIFVKCPGCQASVMWSKENIYKPFCSARCKHLDLGSWANESFRIPVGEVDLLEEANGGKTHC